MSWKPELGARGYSPVCDYFGKVFLQMEQRLQERDLRVYLTWDIRTMPEVGERVVVVDVGDEHARPPYYGPKVRAVFKCFGSVPPIEVTSLRPTRLNLSRLANQLRNWALRFPVWVQGFGRRDYRQARLFAIPLGYFTQPELPLKLFEERKTDIFFAGTVGVDKLPFFSIRRWIPPAKNLSRRLMLTELRRIEVSQKPWRLHVSTPSATSDSAMLPPEEYARLLMDSRICLAPRGNSVETYRLFEGLRYGCIVISEPLPKRWFYEGAPIYQLSDWGRLPALLEELLSNPEEMEERHRASLHWWRTRCSEEAVGRYMADVLNQVL